MRSLERPERRRGWLLSTFGLLGAWLAWMTCARIGVYASAPRARIEVTKIANRVSALEEGKIVALHCELDRLVDKGDVLVELDSSVERAQLDEQEIELASMGAKAAAIREQIAAERTRRESRSRMDALATKQAAFGLKEAEVAAEHQTQLTAIAQQLLEQRLGPRIDAVNAEAELANTRLRLANAGVELERLHASQQYEDSAVVAKIAELRRALAELDAEAPVKRATIETMQAKVARRRITAPVLGRLGNITPLQVGDVLKIGDVIATVIPTDDVHVVAELDPDAAVGRVLPGQTARVRLSAFSWMEFGMLDAVVTHVASEPHAGTIRVELVMKEKKLRNVPIQHGLTGQVDIRIDDVTPFVLLMRSVGAALADDSPSAAQALSSTGGELRP